MRTALILAAASASILSACTTATQCGTSIPEDLRADTFLYVIDKQLVKPVLMPRDDQALALGAGHPFATLPADRQKLVALRAAGYASCLRETVDRSK